MNAILRPISLFLFACAHLYGAPITEVLTYRSTFPESVGGPQPTALKAELNYDDTVTNAPIAVVMHQFSASSGNFSTYRSNAQSLRDRGFFAITPGMRGRDGSDGSRDSGGLEIHDILDAVEAVKALHPDRVDHEHIYITGYSGGGGNVLSALTKFPDYWNAGSSFFGISDYGYDPDEGWYFHGSGSSHRSILRNDIGDPTVDDPLVEDRYFARASYLASGNNPYAEIHLFVNDDESLTPLANHQNYYDHALASASYVGEFDNITHHIGTYGLYADFDKDGIDDTDEHQYWPHKKQNADQQAAAENWFIDRMVGKQIPAPELHSSDRLQVPGYVKTRPFALFLGDGQNAVGALDYDMGEDSQTYTLEILSSDTSVPTLLQIDASGHASRMVDLHLEGSLVESIPGGGLIETSALSHHTTLSVTFTDRPAPLPPILPMPEPIAYWRFESSDAFLDDSGPSGHSLSRGGNSPPTFIALSSAQSGEHFPNPLPDSDSENLGAADLPGSGYFSAGNHSSHQASSFTLEALVSTSALGSGTQYIASRFTSSGGSRSWSFGITGTNAVSGTSEAGELFFVVSANGSDATILGSGQTLMPGKDYYVSVSFSPDAPVLFRTMELSVDNPVLQSTQKTSPVSSLHVTDAPLLIGAYSGGSNPWNGLIDEVRLSTGTLIESHLLISTGLRYQDWLDHFFTDAEQADAAVGGPDADPDHDGLSNLAEFGSGTYPNHSSAAPVTLAPSAGHVDVTARFIDSPDLIGNLCYTDNLHSAWTPVQESQLVEQNSEGFHKSRTYRFDPDEIGDRLFFKTIFSSPAQN